MTNQSTTRQSVTQADPTRNTPSGRRILVICPHFEPDVAPTGVIMTRIVHELAASGFEVHVVTALPWYARHEVDVAWKQVTWRNRTEITSWGSIARLNPRGGGDKTNLFRRAVGFVAFSVACTVAGLRAAPGKKFDGVLAMSPPLTLGLSAKCVAVLRRAPLIFNVQDIFPDAVIETGKITNRAVIAIARVLEKVTYRSARIITVLSNDLRDNVLAKLPSHWQSRVVVIPNFVDTVQVQPMDRQTAYRHELGIGDQRVVMYAGNVGYSQSLDLMVAAARVRPDLVFVINGQGSARADLQELARDLPNVIFGDFQSADRLAEVLATGDIHVVPLQRGLGRVSVPSKVYSIMAAGRPILAAVDADTEVPRLVIAASCGKVVEPDVPSAFIEALNQIIDDQETCQVMGENARRYVESVASPAAVGRQYAKVIADLRS